MAISLQSEGKGGKKSLMADLNLVPYIDLLTCMVAFLLITAVWTQLARLKVSQNGSGETDGVEPPMTKVVVLVGDEGFNLVVDQDRQTIGKKNGEYDFDRLLTELKKVKAGHPDKDDIQVASEDSITFDLLTRTMDMALASGFPAVALLDSGSAGL
jgi:biopolymer transport protein TolR